MTIENMPNSEQSVASNATEQRRAFLRRAAGVAVVAPAATLLLAAAAKRAEATPVCNIYTPC